MSTLHNVKFAKAHTATVDTHTDAAQSIAYTHKLGIYHKGAATVINALHNSHARELSVFRAPSQLIGCPVRVLSPQAPRIAGKGHWPMVDVEITVDSAV